MKGSFLFLSCLMLLLGLCALASAEESGGYTVMCQNLRAPSSKELADPVLSPAHRSELFKTLLAQYAPDVVGLQEAKGVWQELLESYPQDTGYGYTAAVKINPDAQGYTAILYKQSRAGHAGTPRIFISDHGRFQRPARQRSGLHPEKLP